MNITTLFERQRECFTISYFSCRRTVRTYTQFPSSERSYKSNNYWRPHVCEGQSGFLSRSYSGGSALARIVCVKFVPGGPPKAGRSGRKVDFVPRGLFAIYQGRFTALKRKCPSLTVLSSCRPTAASGFETKNLISKEAARD